ncbi:MAG: PD-(D/E)XK nuclease family protein [Candidatus Binataceae bacterium]|nr:PD-(D/E)XK nuclease family protein [Candidatus Binataceae bacterium]
MVTRLAIYPTALKATDQLKRMARDQSCLMGHRIMTFPQLVDALWREADPRGVVLDPIGERLALEAALKCSPPLAAGLAPGPGLVEHLLNLIRQLKGAAIVPGDLRTAIRAAALPAPNHLAEITAMFAAYEELLRSRGLADRHDRERQVLDALLSAAARGDRPRLLAGVDHLLIAEIYDLSLLQFMIAAALIRIIGSADLAIQAEQHRVTSATRFAELTWNRFVGEESIADQVLPHFIRRGGRDGRLGFVLEQLFVGDYPEPPPADDTVRICEAPTRLGEVEETARAIRRKFEAAAPGTIALDRIAIVARDLTPYAGHLETVMGRFGLPIRLGGTQPILAAPPARAVLNLLRVAGDGYRREALAGLCNAVCFRVAAARDVGLLAEIGYLDRATSPLGDRFAAHRAAIVAASGDEPADARRRATLARHDRAAANFARLLAALEPLEQAGTAARHVARLRRVLAALGFDPAAHARDPAGADNAAVAGAIDDTLDAIAASCAAVDPGAILDADAFAALAASAFAEAVYERPGARGAGAGLAALPVLEARGLDFDEVYILGLNDETFPAYRADDPIVPDSARRAINRPLARAMRDRLGAQAAAAPGPILRTRANRNAEDWLLFFLALSMPARRVILSYAIADEGGAPLRRSPFVDEVLKLLGGDDRELIRRVPAQNFLPPLDQCFTRDEFLNWAAAAAILDDGAAQAAAGTRDLGAITRRIAVERARERYLAMPAREDRPDGTADPAKFALAGPFDGRVTASPALRRLVLESADGTPRAFSPSRLNDLAQCGFRYFAGRILDLGEADAPGYESSALERGSLMHRIMHDLTTLKPDFADRAAAHAAARTLLHAVCSRERPAARDQAFFAIEWETAERIVEEFVDYEADRLARGSVRASEIFAEHEIHLAVPDRRSVAAPERIDLPLFGIVDRLEIYRGPDRRITHIRVVDYKNARRADRYRELLKPEKFATIDFQIAVYAMGAIEEFRPDLAPGVTLEGAYLVLRERDKEIAVDLAAADFTIDSAAREALAAASARPDGTPAPPPIADRIVALAADAVAGRFDVDPLKCDDFCAFRPVCRYRKAAV